MLIAIDIGNSSINIGYFTDKGLLTQKTATHPLRDVQEYRLILNDFLAQNNIEKKHISCIISSVVAGHTAVIEAALSGLAGNPDVLIVGHNMDTGLRYKISNPEKLGADRIAGVAGACGFYKPPVAVVDCGTATTITAVDPDFNIIGGAIMPGLGLMNDALGKGTSGLQKIELMQPGPALGKDTEGCIRSGLFYGSAGAVERILSEIEGETGYGFTVVVTGGYGPLLAEFIKRAHEINPHLILEGLKILYDKNRHA